jgi:predicted MFS family arabinose efflux permease
MAPNGGRARRHPFRGRHIKGKPLVNTATTPGSAAAEWRAFWPLVAASTLGFSLHSLAAYSVGLFMEPLGAEFGWSRAQISLATVIPAFIMVVGSPWVGGLVDRLGSRRLALPSIAMTGISIALASTVGGSLWHWVAVWFLYGIVSLGAKLTVWTTAVTSAFSAGRGMALGVMLCGTALAQIIAPPLAQQLIDNYGWREAYLLLGLGWATPCFILALFFLYDARDRVRVRRARGAAEQATAPAALARGLTPREALRSVPLLRIGASTLLTMFISTAIIVHQVPILTSIGVPRAEAAWLASLAGAAGVVGKLSTGWMTDRWDASLIGAISLAVPAGAYLLLMNDHQPLALTMFAMIVIGYTMGTKLQICAYLTARFAGMRHYGKIFGVMSSLIAVGGGIGSVAAGAIFDTFGSYEPLLLFGAVSSIVCGALLFRLGRYPDWTDETPQAGVSSPIPLMPERT